MIYLDYQATTPLAPEVEAAMLPWLEKGFANPHSSHRPGRAAAAACEVGREQILGALHDFAGGPQEGRLVFTSGATEAINWALKGAAARLPADRRRIVTLATEHDAVLRSAEWLKRLGFALEVLPVGPDGIVDLHVAAAAITEQTAIVAAMFVNNEIGVVQPIAELGALAKAAGALFLCDAVQGFGRVPMPLHVCDMVAITAHKVYGPKGVGALWVRDGTPLDPFMHGGGQEKGDRSGTLSPALCAGFGAAAKLLAERREVDEAHTRALAETARRLLADWTINGSTTHRIAGNLNIRRDGVDSSRLIADLRGVALSAGSACASGSGQTSHVLAAIGLDRAAARSALRIGFGRYTTEGELIQAIGAINQAAERQSVLAA